MNNTYALWSTSRLLKTPNFHDGVLDIMIDPDKNLYCPDSYCHLFYKSQKTLKKHLTNNHIDTTAPVAEIDKTREYQPSGLEGAFIVVSRVSKRAVCRASSVHLRRDEIPHHIYSCRACCNWKRRIVFPKVNSTNNTLDEKTEPPLIETSNPGQPSAYKVHQPFEDAVRTMELVTRQQPNEKHREVYVPTNLNMVQVENPPKKINRSFQEQLKIHVKMCTEIMDQACVSLQRAVISRMTIDDKIVDSLQPFYNCLPYDHNDIESGMQVEARLANIEYNHDLYTCEDAAWTYSKLMFYLDLVARWAGFDLSEVLISVNESSKGFELKRGRLLIKSQILPWCLAELLLEFILFIRPLQKTADYEAEWGYKTSRRFLPYEVKSCGNPYASFTTIINETESITGVSGLEGRDELLKIKNDKSDYDLFSANEMLKKHRDPGHFLLQPYELSDPRNKKQRVTI